MKLNKILERVDCEEGCSCLGHEAVRRLKLAVEAMREWQVISCPEDASRVILKALREIEGSE